MKIWLVNTDMENTCAWSTKEKAINYFKEECKDCGWTWRILYDGKEEDPESCLSYFVTTEDSCKFHVDIFSIYLDEKPYLEEI